MRTHVIVVDYKAFVQSEDAYQEIRAALADFEICILINNQTYTVPVDYAHPDLVKQSIEACAL